MERQYKDSGIEWIGRIPKEWKTTKLNYVYRFQTGATPPTNNEKYFDGNYKWASIADLKCKVIFDTAKKLSKEGIEKCSMNISPKGSLMYSFKLSVGTVSFCGEDMYTNEAIATFLKGYGYLPYLYYMAPFAIIHNANYNIYGAPILNQELIKSATVIVPPLPEQRRIADYLDKKCGEIDGLVSLQEQMIQTLTDYKQSVITEAVTKGLNPNAHFVPSGIDWIGEIPEGWKVCKLKNVYRLLNGRAFLDPELLEEGKYRILRVGNLFSSDKWYFSDMELDADKYCETGDLLYGWSASIGPYIWQGEKVIYHYHIWKVLFGNNDLHFSYYLLQALTLAKQRDMHGSAMQHLTKVNMENSKIALPPLSNQHAIASYLDTKCSEIDSLIALKRQKIDMLKDYKKSVIYEAVTGKTGIEQTDTASERLKYQ